MLAVAVLGVVIVIDAAAVAVVVVLCENVKLLLNNHSALSGPRGEHYKHCEEKFPMRMQGGDLIKMFSASVDSTLELKHFYWLIAVT